MADFDFSHLNSDNKKNGFDFSHLNSSSDEDDIHKKFRASLNAYAPNAEQDRSIVPDLLAGSISGLGKGGQQIASWATGGKAPTVDFDELVKPIRSKGKRSEGAYGVGEYLPYGIAGGSSLLGQAIAGAGAGTALTKPEEENLWGWLPKGKLGGAIEGALLNMLPHAGKVLEKARPSKMFRGNLSNKQLIENLNAAEGTNTGLGDVIGSPTLKKYLENRLPQIPLSGAEDAMLETAGQIKNKGNALLSDIGINENTRGEGIELQNALKEAHKETRIEKNANFEKVNEIADKTNLQVGRTNFSKVAQEAINDIKESPELEKLFPADLRKNIEYYASNPKGNNLKLSNIFKGKLGDEAHELYQNGKMHEHGIIKNLQNALQTDIDEAIENSGSQELKDQYVKSQKEYKEKFAPFDDPDIVKFTRKGGDPDLMLSHFLRKGKDDRAVILSKLTSKLGQSQNKTLPLRMYLSSAIENGELNPSKLKGLYKDLGKNQKKVLIEDKKINKRLKDYQKLVEMNSEPLSLMANPKTGMRALGANYAGLQTMLSAAGGYAAGWPGALASTILPIIEGRFTKGKLTSPKVRESLVREMIANKPKFTNPKAAKTFEILSQSILDSMRERENGSR
jgi:hypothetical protein